MQLSPDLPVGHPALQLSDDQVATVVDLICRGVAQARSGITAGMLEVPLTIVIRKEMRRVKHTLSLTNLEVRGEHELDDMTTTTPVVPGRIDISLKFLHQFGFEDAYVAVECKRVGHRHLRLNKEYVTKGVNRFVTGQYSSGHSWGMMLGYTIALPLPPVTDSIDRRLRASYGDVAALVPHSPIHQLALATFSGTLEQIGTNHRIRLMHLFVDLTVAARVVSKRKRSPRLAV